MFDNKHTAINTCPSQGRGYHEIISFGNLSAELQTHSREDPCFRGLWVIFKKRYTNFTRYRKTGQLTVFGFVKFLASVNQLLK